MDVPYTDRQLISVLPDEIVEAARKAEAEAVRTRPADSKLGLTASVLAASFWTPSLVALVASVTSDAVKAWAKARENGLNVLQISRSEAATLTFPPGHPRAGVIYVGHPAIPSIYYTVASFHRRTFEHKLNEVVDLLMHLGATEIRVEHVRGWSREVAGGLSLTLPLGDTVGLKASSNTAARASLLYEASLSGSSSPKLPERSFWYIHEPTWQGLASGRMGFGLNDFRLAVIYEDDFGINAGLKATVQRAGFDLGGTFEDHQSTTWIFHGKFLPVAK